MAIAIVTDESIDAAHEDHPPVVPEVSVALMALGACLRRSALEFLLFHSTLVVLLFYRTWPARQEAMSWYVSDS